MEVDPGQWIVPPKKRKAKRYSYRGGKNNVALLHQTLSKNCFKCHKLEDRIKNSQLGPLYTSLLKFEFVSAVIYNTLVRSVQSEVVDELLFRFGDTTCRFGRREFALISGLSFKPLEEGQQGIIDTLTTSLLAMKDPETGVAKLTPETPYSGPLANVNRPILEREFDSITDPDVMLKVSLIYLIDVAFHGKDKESLSPLVFHMVEDIDLFLSYPWGTYFWEISLSDWKSRVLNLQSLSMDDKRNPRTPPNEDILGLVSVLNAWVCETLPHEARFKFAVPLNVEIPRVLRWNNTEGRHFVKNVCKIFEGVKTGARRFIRVDDEEMTLLHQMGFTDEQINTFPVSYIDPVVEEKPASLDNDPVDSDTMDLEDQDPTDDAPTQSHHPPTHVVHARPPTSSHAVPMEGIRQVVREVVSELLDEHMKKIDEKMAFLDRKVDSVRRDLVEHIAEHKNDMEKMKIERTGDMGSIIHLFQTEVLGMSFDNDSCQQQQLSPGQQHKSPEIDMSTIFTDDPPLNIDDVMVVGGNMVNASLMDTSVVVEGTSSLDKRPPVDGDTTPAPLKKQKPVKQKQPIVKPAKRK